MNKNVSGPQPLASLEYLRVVSAFGVVWFHMRDEWDRNIGYAGLFSFTMITTFLAYRSVKRRGFSEYARDRFHRLIVPWLFWSVFYISIRLALGTQLSLRSVGEVLEPTMLLGGGHTVLWYLSFMYLVSIMTYGTVAATRRFSPLCLSMLFLFASICVVVLRPTLFGSVSTSYPFSQWIAVTPAVLLGLAAGSASDIASRKSQLLTLATMALIMVAGTTFAFRSESDLGALSIGLGALGFIFALWVRLPASRMVKGLSELTLGIYVLHPCMVKLIQVSAWPIPFPLDVSAVFGLSALCVVALRRFSLLRRVV